MVTSEPAAKPVEPPVEASVEDAPPVVQPPAVEKPAPAPVKKTVERAKAEPKPNRVVQVPPKTKLDLSLPPELAAQLDAENRAADDGLPPILPSFFEEKKPSLNPFQISGKLLTGEPGSETFDAVEGAELHFEFRR